MKIPSVTIPKNEKILGNIIDVPIKKIIPNSNQPRKNFGDDDIAELSASIEENGIIQPLTVRDSGEKYELVTGERRLRAAVKCGFECVPCIVMEISDRDSAVMALVENIQRKDLSFFEEAEAIRKMIDIYGITQEEAALRLGKTQSTIANKIRLLKLPEDERRLISELNLTERHARALLKILDKETRIDLIKMISERNLNVEKTEKEIDRINFETKEKEKLKRRSGLFRHMSLFANSINHAVDIMRAAGVECSSDRINGDDYVEFVIKISKDQLYD